MEEELNSTTKENEIDIDSIIEKLDEEKAQEFYEKSSAEAEDILKDEDKMERFFQKLEKKLKTVPVAGTVLAYVPLMMSLVRSYVKKEYTEPPITSMISIVVALIYFLSPVDLIPDIVPGAGYVDDAVVISGCLALIRTDLEDYRIWRKNQGLELDDIPDYEEIAKEATSNNKFASAFFKGRKSVQK